jgi:hypothetical protein
VKYALPGAVRTSTELKLCSKLYVHAFDIIARGYGSKSTSDKILAVPALLTYGCVA